MGNRNRSDGLALLFVAVFTACTLSAAAEAQVLPSWSAEVQALLQRLLADRAADPRPTGAAPLVVFDFDNTMILGDIGVSVLVQQAEQHRFGFDPAQPNKRFSPDLVRQFSALQRCTANCDQSALRRRIRYQVIAGYHDAWNSGGKSEACAYLVQLLEGMTPAEVADLTRQTLREALRAPFCSRTFVADNPAQAAMTETTGVRLRPAIQAMVTRLQSAGFEIWVVSASAQRIVEVAAGLYGIAPDHVIGVRSVEAFGRLTADIVRPIPFRQGKVDAIREKIGRRPILAFGDAWTDFEMLQWAEHAVLLDRGEQDIVQACRAAGILIQPPFDPEPQPQTCTP